MATITQIKAIDGMSCYTHHDMQWYQLTFTNGKTSDIMADEGSIITLADSLQLEIIF